MPRKRNYDDWSREELIREIEALRRQKTYGLVWERDKTKEVFDYYINWNGVKTKEVFKDVEDKFPVLKEVKNMDVVTDKNGACNLLIEGDNYHSLAVLNFTHNKAIDVIYIDPPYNTGSKDFKFNDKWVDKEDSYRHSKWLSFMERRLKLARNLLKDSGVIFISIDYNEVAQLKILCDEIFGEKNYVEQIIWRKKEGGGQQDDFWVTEHEYVLVYARNRSKMSLIEKSVEKSGDGYKCFDEKKRKKYKPVKLAKWGSGALREDRPTMYFSIKDPDGKNNFPVAPDGRPGRWRYGKVNVLRLVKEDAIEWVKKGKKWVPYEKVYEPSEDELKILKQRSIFYDYATTRDGTNELTEIFGVKDKFPNPKPTLLIMELLLLTAKPDATVLDFFAGSGTTGHAVLRLNEMDKGCRKYILCTNNEEGICTEVCYPRLERVMKGYRNGKGSKTDGLGSNLKYFRTDFVDSAPTDMNKKKIVDKSTEMLCIKENAFGFVKGKKGFKIFRNSNVYLGIIFDDEAVDDFVAEAKKIKGKFHVYVFSLDDSVPDYEFRELKGRVKLCPIPEVILHVYRRVFKDDRA
ncbi:MAG: site-specific DNA-methyltransferase [Candidatus Hodarchaeales archaeon]